MGYFSVAISIHPLKQGLKLTIILPNNPPYPIEEVHPLKQGLKLQVICNFPSFHLY